MNKLACRFTPAKEVQLCGHATLAAAHVLYETAAVPSNEKISFHTVHSGVLTAVHAGAKGIELDFPATPPSAISLPNDDMNVLCAGLGITRDAIIFVGESIYDLFVEIKRETFLSLGQIQYSRLAEFDKRGVIVTCIGGTSSATVPVTNPLADTHFLSRFFAPR
jgi:predicted PhzF superfamily epimerase YddE/YHI9